MTDADLMSADCVHGVAWYDCTQCALLHAIEQARAAGVDVEQVMIDELRDMGYEITRCEIDWPGPDTYEPSGDSGLRD